MFKFSKEYTMVYRVKRKNPKKGEDSATYKPVDVQELKRAEQQTSGWYRAKHSKMKFSYSKMFKPSKKPPTKTPVRTR